MDIKYDDNYVLNYKHAWSIKKIGPIFFRHLTLSKTLEM